MRFFRRRKQQTEQQDDLAGVLRDVQRFTDQLQVSSAEIKKRLTNLREHPHG